MTFPSNLNSQEKWLTDLAQINLEIEMEARVESYRGLMQNLIDITNQLGHCHSLFHLPPPKIFSIKQIVEKILKQVNNDDENYQNIKSLKVLLTIDIDAKNPFNLSNYGNEGLEMLRVLSLIYPAEFAIGNPPRDYREL